MPTHFSATGFSGNSRPRRLKIAEPSGCKSRVADRRVVNREQQTGSTQDRTALGVQVCPRRPIWNSCGMSTGRASRTCLLNSGLPEKGVWCESTAFRHLCARSSKRAGGLIPRIALDQCRVPERYRTRVPFFVPIAQSTERARPKRQVAGESPAGDTSFADVVQQQNAAMPRPRRRCDSVHPLHFGGRSSPAEVLAHGHHLTCERQRGRHAVGRPQGPPTIFEGIAQSAERVRHMHQVEGANPSALTICPCGVVQSTRLPLMQKITGAKPVRDASFCPQSIWSDALLWYGNQLGAIPGGGSSFWASG
jgi:hypothetical protein